MEASSGKHILNMCPWQVTRDKWACIYCYSFLRKPLATSQVLHCRFKMLRWIKTYIQNSYFIYNTLDTCSNSITAYIKPVICLTVFRWIFAILPIYGNKLVMMNRRMKCKMFFMFCLEEKWDLWNVKGTLHSSFGVYVNVSTASDNRPSDNIIFNNILASVVFGM